MGVGGLGVIAIKVIYKAKLQRVYYPTNYFFEKNRSVKTCQGIRKEGTRKEELK